MRYFMVTYTGNNNRGQQVIGNVSTKGKEFPSHKELMDYFSQQGVVSATITNLYEFKSKDDFDAFYGVEETEQCSSE